MELNLAHDVIRINETVFDGSVEQSIEQDYALPDYYPEIFKVLKSTISPSVYNCRISGQKLVVDGLIAVKIIYQNEEDSKIHSITQKYPFSKTVDLKEEVENPTISYSSSGDYVNCRVVNPKRIDLRGAVTIRITVSDQREVELLSNAEGAGVQLYRGTMRNVSSHLSGSKQFTAEEQFEVFPPVEEIVYFHTSTVMTDCKIITNKLVTKGELFFHMLYRTSDGEMPLKTFSQKVSISQIIDLPGVDEDYKCHLLFHNTDTDIKPETDEDGTTLYVSFSITALADAYIQKDVGYVKAAFSTAFEAETNSKELVSENLAQMIDTTLTSKQQIELQNIKEVVDFWAEVDNIDADIRGDALHFTGDLSAELMVVDNDENTALLERTIPIEFDLPSNISCDDPVIDSVANILGISHELNGNMLSFEVEFKLSGIVFCYEQLRIINELNINEDKPKDNSARSALTIYYADAGEHLWDISKRYNTSMDAVMEENSLDSTIVENRKMLLIPIVE